LPALRHVPPPQETSRRQRPRRFVSAGNREKRVGGAQHGSSVLGLWRPSQHDNQQGRRKHSPKLPSPQAATDLDLGGPAPGGPCPLGPRAHIARGSGLAPLPPAAVLPAPRRCGRKRGSVLAQRLSSRCGAPLLGRHRGALQRLGKRRQLGSQHRRARPVGGVQLHARLDHRRQLLGALLRHPARQNARRLTDGPLGSRLHSSSSLRRAPCLSSALAERHGWLC